MVRRSNSKNVLCTLGKSPKKVGSIGIPVKGGNFKIKMSNKGNENVGELIYSEKMLVWVIAILKKI